MILMKNLEFEEIPDLDDEDLTDTINNKKRQRRNSYETLGRKITKEENQLVHNFNESISFDQKLLQTGYRGSIAHVTMLAKQGSSQKRTVTRSSQA